MWKGQASWGREEEEEGVEAEFLFEGEGEVGLESLSEEANVVRECQGSVECEQCRSKQPSDGERLTALRGFGSLVSFIQR
jgi:hypothetical protein